MNALDKIEDYDRLATAFENLRKELATANACAERKQREIDELAAQVEMMRGALIAQRELDYTQAGRVTGAQIESVAELQEKALSTTGPEALAEVKSGVLQHCADYFRHLDENVPMAPSQVANSIERQAASIRKGEE